MSYIGKIIRLIREEHGDSQVEMAKKLSEPGDTVYQTRLSDIEAGKIIPSTELISKIAEIYDCDELRFYILGRQFWGGILGFNPKFWTTLTNLWGDNKNVREKQGIAVHRGNVGRHG